MEIAIYLIPVSIFFGCILLWALFWNINNNQYDDLEGEASRILHQDEFDRKVKKVKNHETKL